MGEQKKILTYTGLKALEEELETLKVVKRKEVAEKIKEAREQVPFTVFQGIEISSIKRILSRLKLNGYLKVQCLVNTADESELPSQAVTVFAWSSKKHVVLHYSDERVCVFC